LQTFNHFKNSSKIQISKFKIQNSKKNTPDGTHTECEALAEVVLATIIELDATSERRKVLARTPIVRRRKSIPKGAIIICGKQYIQIRYKPVARIKPTTNQSITHVRPTGNATQ
jgi:hypothetical protein